MRQKVLRLLTMLFALLAIALSDGAISARAFDGCSEIWDDGTEGDCPDPLPDEEVCPARPDGCVGDPVVRCTTEPAYPPWTHWWVMCAWEAA
jgi:hypothetical protein